MRQRGVLFTTVLIVVSIIVTVPIVIGFVQLALIVFMLGGNPFPFLGFQRKYWQNSDLEGIKVVRDRLLWREDDSVSDDDEESQSRLKWKFHTADPETGRGLNDADSDWRIEPLELSVQEINQGNFEIESNANHVWMFSGVESSALFELDGDRFARRNLQGLPTKLWVGSENEYWVGNAGKPTYLVTLKTGSRELLQVNEGRWQYLGEIVLLDTRRGWQNTEQGSLLIPQDSASGIKGNWMNYVHVVHIGSTSHLVWFYGNRLLYRRGIELKPAVLNSDESSEIVSSIETAASALEPVNVVGIANDWFLIKDETHPNNEWMTVSVRGEPAFIEIDKTNLAYPIARAFRIEDGHILEFASTELPFASQDFVSGMRSDGLSSYLIATTRMGRTRVVAIEPGGFRQTQFDHSTWPDGIQGYIQVATALVVSLGAALILAAVATFLMRRDVADYGFGVQTVALASVWERLMARGLDFVFVLVVAAAVFFSFSSIWNPDWKTAADAWNLEVFDHPSLVPVERIVITVLASMVVSSLLLIVVAGRTGLSPGKWICGIRIVRATLKPCGIARSMVREILLCVDSLNLISWTPGILCIAFTANRQRLGDLAADTLVVRAKSLTAGGRQLV